MQNRTVSVGEMPAACPVVTEKSSRFRPELTLIVDNSVEYYVSRLALQCPDYITYPYNIFLRDPFLWRASFKLKII